MNHKHLQNPCKTPEGRPTGHVLPNGETAGCISSYLTCLNDISWMDMLAGYISLSLTLPKWYLATFKKVQMWILLGSLSWMKLTACWTWDLSHRYAALLTKTLCAKLVNVRRWCLVPHSLKKSRYHLVFHVLANKISSCDFRHMKRYLFEQSSHS